MKARKGESNRTSELIFDRSGAALDRLQKAFVVGLDEFEVQSKIFKLLTKQERSWIREQSQKTHIIG